MLYIQVMYKKLGENQNVGKRLLKLPPPLKIVRLHANNFVFFLVHTLQKLVGS